MATFFKTSSGRLSRSLVQMHPHLMLPWIRTRPSNMATRPSKACALLELSSSLTVNSASCVSFRFPVNHVCPLTGTPVSDASILLRDMAGDAAQKAANKVNPTDEELNQIDRPAEDNTWHDVPDLSKENLKNQAKAKYNEQKPFSREEARGALGDATQVAHPTGSRDPADAADLAARDQRYGGDSGVDAAKGAQYGADQLHQTARENVPQETQDRAREYRERGTGYIKEKIPEERRDQAIYRLKKMIVEIQGHQDCKSHVVVGTTINH